MLPAAYAIRNLARTPGRTLQLVLGSALVVALVVAAAGFARGMRHALAASGDPGNVILLGAGAEASIERSAITPNTGAIAAAAIPDVRSVVGHPAVSPEVHHDGLVHLDRQERQALWRGITPGAFAVYSAVRLIDGTLPGPDGVLVGRYAHHRLGVPAERLAVGETLQFEGRTWTVSGIFAAPGTVLESEIWCDLHQLMAAVRRDTISCVVLALDPRADIADVEMFCLMRTDLELTAMRETDYYGGLTAFFAPLQTMAWLTALLIAAGAALGGINTLYAAFAARIRELATLQAVGFSRGAIFMSLLQEALLAVGLGTALGLGAAQLGLGGLAVPFSSGIFTLAIEANEVLVGCAAGLALGFLGTLPPAWRCLAPPLPDALRAA